MSRTSLSANPNPVFVYGTVAATLNALMLVAMLAIIRRGTATLVLALRA